MTPNFRRVFNSVPTLSTLSRTRIPTSLSPELHQQLKQRTEHVLAALIRRNSVSQFFCNAPELSSLSNGLTELTSCQPLEAAPNNSLVSLFRTTVPLTTYETYKPFISRFLSPASSLSGSLNASDVRDMFSPGLPYYIAVSSATSGKAPKYFAKYRHPPGVSYESVDKGANPVSETGGTNCVIYSLNYFQKLVVVDEEEKTCANVLVTINSSGSVRMQNGLDVEKDPFLLHYTGPRATSPLAVSFIAQYRTFLLMHALFALTDVRLETFSTLFGTVFVDMVRYMEEEWDTLVACIDNGTLPNFDGVEAVRPYLQKHWRSRPERAAELRQVEVNSPAWLHKVWPNLKVVIGIASGTFASVIPKMQMILGDTVYLRSLGFTASEAYVGTVYGYGDINCFKTVSDDIIEFLDASLPEDAQTSDRCLMPWEVAAGKQYEIILTTRDGLWRYRLGDIIEVTGFEPNDGSPIIKYIERKNIAMRFTNAQVREQELVSAIFSLDESTLGPVAEFTVCEDTRATPSTVGYIVELASFSYPASTSDLRLGANPTAAPQKVLGSLMELNQRVQIGYEKGSIGMPTIRVVSGGTFREYRRWRIEKTNSGAGQMKVPVVMRDEESLKWLLQRVVFECCALGSTAVLSPPVT